MRKLLAMLMALVLVFSLAACGSEPAPSGGDTPAPAPDGGDTPAPAPTATKTEFTYALGGSPNYLDPDIAAFSIGS